MVSADRDRVNIWASSAYTGVLQKLLKQQADVERESTKCTKFKIQVAEKANMRIFVGMVKWDAELKIIHSMFKWIDFFVAQISLEMLFLLRGVVYWKEDRRYSRFHGTSHGHGLK